jgi:hypothetical protein
LEKLHNEKLYNLYTVPLIIRVFTSRRTLWAGHVSHMGDVKCVEIQTNKLRGLSPQANYTDRATAAVGEVVPTFAGRGCYVVSATDSLGR